MCITESTLHNKSCKWLPGGVKCEANRNGTVSMTKVIRPYLRCSEYRGFRLSVGTAFSVRSDRGLHYSLLINLDFIHSYSFCTCLKLKSNSIFFSWKGFDFNRKNERHWQWWRFLFACNFSFHQTNSRLVVL